MRAGFGLRAHAEMIAEPVAGLRVCQRDAPAFSSGEPRQARFRLRQLALQRHDPLIAKGERLGDILRLEPLRDMLGAVEIEGLDVEDQRALGAGPSAAPRRTIWRPAGVRTIRRRCRATTASASKARFPAGNGLS